MQLQVTQDASNWCDWHKTQVMLWMKDLKYVPYVWLLQLQNTFTDVNQISCPLQLDI